MTRSASSRVVAGLMKPTVFAVFIFALSVSCMAGDTSDIETDDAYHIARIKDPAWKKADKNEDGIITIADKGGWWHNRHYDVNDDEQVDYDEFISNYTDPDAGRILRNVVYKEATGQKCLMDIYYPAGEYETPAPVFYFVHGGGWMAGTKDIGGQVKKVFDGLLDQGIVCVSISYRLVTRDIPDDPVVMSDCVTDAMDGLRFLKKHSEELGVDADRVVTLGNSAGGHISLMLTYSEPSEFPGDPALLDYPVRPVAGINWYGPSDFTVTELFIPDVEGWKGNPDRFTGRMKKGVKVWAYSEANEEVRALMRKLSPVYHLKEGSPPVLTIHGDRDTTIPRQHSPHLVEKAKEVGSDVTFLPVANTGHGWHEGSDPTEDEILAATVDFAVKHLKR